MLSQLLTTDWLLFFLQVCLYTHFLLSLQPLHRELYSMHAASFFVPSFLKAIKDNTEESFRSIINEPSPGILVFSMLQPRFCKMLLSEVLVNPLPVI